MATHEPDGEMSWQSRLLAGFLRVAIRSVVGGTTDILALRRRLLRVDRLFPDTRGAFRRTPVKLEEITGSWYSVPESREDRVILYLHGGGFFMPLMRLQLPFLQGLCVATRARAFVPDYRLVPEHPFPTATQDCHAAYRHLLMEGCDPRRMMFVGDSAGGNLTLTTLMQARDASEPLPACAALLSPTTDLTLSGDSFKTNAGRDASFPATMAAQHLRAYVPRESVQARHPLASPLFGDFSELPPLLIQAGSHELLTDDSVRAARIAGDHGVDVDLQIWPRMQHIFQMYQWVPEARRALADIADFGEARWR